VLADDVELTVPDRDYAIDLGLEALTDGNWGRLQLAAYHDVSNTHHGYEIAVDYAYAWRRQRWHVAPSIGFSYKSDDLNDYYWGVRPEESSAALPAYQAESGVNRRARVAASYQLRRDLSIAFAAEYELLNAEAAASPIVEDEDVLGAFVGLNYRF
jgi:outer membrane protein